MHMVRIAEAIVAVFFNLPKVDQLISFLGTEKEIAIILSLCMRRTLGDNVDDLKRHQYFA